MEAALRTVLEMVTGEKVEKLLRPRRHHPAPRVRGRPLRRDCRSTKVGPVPDLLQHLVPRLGLAARRDLEGRRVPRHGQRQEGDGGHRRPAGRSASATSSSSWPAPADAWAAAASRLRPARPSAPRGPRRSTPRTAPTRCANRTRTRPSLQLYERFLTDGPCGHKSHELLHTHYTPRGKYIV